MQVDAALPVPLFEKSRLAEQSTVYEAIAFDHQRPAGMRGEFLPGGSTSKCIASNSMSWPHGLPKKWPYCECGVSYHDWLLCGSRVAVSVPNQFMVIAKSKSHRQCFVRPLNLLYLSYELRHLRPIQRRIGDLLDGL
jgi:hypothetical protein